MRKPLRQALVASLSQLALARGTQVHSSHVLGGPHAGCTVNPDQKVIRINCWWALNVSNTIFLYSYIGT